MNNNRSRRRLSGSTRCAWLLVGAAASAMAASGSGPTDEPFSQGMHEIMMRMDQAMDAPAPAGVDAQFIAMMVPHHQAAVDMAVLQLRYGHNAQLARLSQEIIVEQQQEIAVMRRIAQSRP